MSKQTNLNAFFKPKTPLRTVNMDGENRPRKRRVEPDSPFSSDQPKYEQTVLDAGQRVIGLVKCEKCGMVYNVDHPVDVKLHNEHHRDVTDFIAAFYVTDCMLERTRTALKMVKISDPAEAYLFVAREGEKSPLTFRAGILMERCVHPAVGFCKDVPIWAPNRLMLILVARIPEDKNPDTKNQNFFMCGLATIDPLHQVKVEPECSIVSDKEATGIYSIWVHQLLRRQGFAKAMVKCAPYLLYSREVAAKSEIAFYDPSFEGKELARSVAPKRLGHGRYFGYPYTF